MLHSRSAVVQGYKSTGDWLTQEDHESSEHSVTVVLESPDKYQAPTKGCPCPQVLHCLLTIWPIAFHSNFIFLHFFFCCYFKKLFHFHSRSMSPACLLLEFHSLPGQEENVMHRGNSNCYYENLLGTGKRKRWQRHAA